MERGLYAAASAMLAQQTIQEALAQNIANANTVGYKQDNPTFKALHGMALQRTLNSSGSGQPIGELGIGVQTDQPYTDWQKGAMSQTNNPLDVSLDPNQFFAVRATQGERYTRAGNFKLDGQGNLLTANNEPVLGVNNQPIVARGNGNVIIERTGSVKLNGAEVGKLKIVQADTAQMRKDGNSLFAAAKPAAMRLVANADVHPGMLEQSNVDGVHALVEMMTVSRSFDMAQRALLTQDELLKHASSELGKL